MTARRSEAQLAEALAWIVRLPLLGDRELAGLLGIDEIDARYLRVELDQQGWVEWLAPRVVELDEQRRAAFLRADALDDLAACSGFAAHEIAHRAPVRQTDVLARIPRIATVTAVNRLLAELAAQLRAQGEMALVDAGSLPIASANRWWPFGADAYGVVRGRRGAARFFVTWDRAGVPDGYRRLRIRKWAAEVNPAEPPWVFVVCADAHAARVWDAELRSQASQAALSEVRLTTADEVLASGPRAAIWSIPGAPARLRFEQALPLRSTDLAALLAFPGMCLHQRPSNMPVLRDRLRIAAVRPAARSIREDTAALAIVTSAADKACLDWLARHPRLSVSELALFLELPGRVVARRLELLAGDHAVRRLEIEGTELWCVTARTLRMLAEAEGVPWNGYERYGAVSAPSTADDAATRPSMAHQLGINHVFARLARDAQAAGWRLGVWRNEAESAHLFVSDGRRAWIRPDGSGAFWRGHEERPFLLEYDRGTLDAGDYRGKFAGYMHYFETTEWRERFSTEPQLLFVGADRRAEQRVRSAVVANGATHLPILLTTEGPVSSGAGSWRWASVARDAERGALFPAVAGSLSVGRLHGE
ncbi:MAG: hypothetical protein C4558_08910 [Dehalococcoidia bacterium]|nr:MAG: hypothetical protein C4558_08910 [Dehalococcoidia bacterium]